MLEDGFEEPTPKKSKKPKKEKKSKKDKNPAPVVEMDDEGYDSDVVEQQLSPKELKRLKKEEEKRQKQLDKELKKSKSKKPPKSKGKKSKGEPEIVADDAWLDSMTDDTMPEETSTADLDELFSQPSPNEKASKGKKVKPDKPAKPEKGTESGAKSKKKSTLLNIGGHSNRCTNPKFRKEDVHSATMPILDIDCLYLSKDMQMLYPDELARHQQEHYDSGVSVYDEISTELDLFDKELDTHDTTFDAEDFLSGMEDLNISPITPYEEHEDITGLMQFEPEPYPEPEMPDELPEIEIDMEDELGGLPMFDDIDEIDEIAELDLPELKVGIDTSKTGLNDTVLDLGESSGGTSCKSTSITFNKEHLSKLTGGNK